MIGLRAFLTRIVEHAPSLATDAVALVGAGLVVRGVAQMYEPAGYIAAGAGLVAAAVILTKR